MPCRYDPGPEDYLRSEKERNKKLRDDLDRLTHENDQLREALLRLINEDGYILPQPIVEKIEATQAHHRREDLTRLEGALRELLGSGITVDPLHGINLFEAMGRVLMADPARPLYEQLDFDPDIF